MKTKLMLRMLDAFLMLIAVCLFILCGLFLPVQVKVEDPVEEEEELSTEEAPAIAA